MSNNGLDNAFDELTSKPTSKNSVPLDPKSEQALAIELVNAHRHQVRFVGDLKEWFVYNRTCWIPDDRRQVYSWAQEICRCAGADLLESEKTRRFARILTSAKTRAAVVSMASDNQRISLTSKDFDAEELLLGGPRKTLDCAEGEARPPSWADYITKRTAVDAAPPHTPAPHWQRFLETTFPLRDHGGPDYETIGLLQRFAGYCLTALTTEQKFLFFYGTGRNGKNVLADTLRGVLGDYAVCLPSEVLMQRPVEPHRSELMPLRGARLIVANEIRKGARWNQARLMEITGGDQLTANPMRGNPITFPVVGKLLVLGNHRPKFESHNAAAIQRLLLVHFPMQFVDPNGAPPSPDLPPERVGRREKDLANRLRSEWPAILRWMLDGYLQYREVGLQPPKQVLADSFASIASDDLFVQWRAERCEDLPRGTKGRDSLTTLRKSYTHWSETQGERPPGRSDFRKILEQHDIQTADGAAGIVPLGFQLTNAERQRLKSAEQSA
jgi:putative DNA primase/helicase